MTGHSPTTNLLLKSAAFFHAAFLLSPKKSLSTVEILRKPFLAVFQGGHMEIPKTIFNAGKPQNNAIIDPILDAIAEYQNNRSVPFQFLRDRGINNGYIQWFERCLKNGPRWSDKIAGSGWQSMTLAFPATGEDYPAYVIVPRAPRQCDVTGQWFIPVHDNQRFAPGLSEAVKRAARRDLPRARAMFREKGDWGKRG